MASHARFNRRSRASRRGVTVVELTLLSGVLAVAAAGTLFFFGSRESRVEEARSSEAAARILGAAEDFRSENPSGCPSLTQLKRAQLLDQATPAHDAWGEQFRVHCTDSGVSVVSPGPDGQLNSADDVRVPSQS